MVVETGHRLLVHTVLQRHAQQLRKQRRSTDAHMQCMGFTGGVHGGAHAHQTGGTVQVVLHVLFAAPHQFDRLARHLHGNRHGLACEILRAFAAQSTADLHGVHTHFFLRHVCG